MARVRITLLEFLTSEKYVIFLIFYAAARDKTLNTARMTFVPGLLRERTHSLLRVPNTERTRKYEYTCVSAWGEGVDANFVVYIVIIILCTQVNCRLDDDDCYTNDPGNKRRERKREGEKM